MREGIRVRRSSMLILPKNSRIAEYLTAVVEL